MTARASLATLLFCYVSAGVEPSGFPSLRRRSSASRWRVFTQPNSTIPKLARYYRAGVVEIEMGWFSKLFGGRRTQGRPEATPSQPQATPSPPEVAPERPPPKPEPLQPEPRPTSVTAQTEACRDRYWSSIGTPEPDVIGYLISPALMGGPAWPSLRPAYRVVRRPNSIIVATEGLSNPFGEDELPPNGFEMELFLETRDIAPAYAGTPGNVDPLRHSWVLAMVEEIADTVADAGGIMSMLDKYGALSIELPGFAQSSRVIGQVPSRFITEAGNMGALLGVPASDRTGVISDTPFSPVELVSIVLLTAAELERVRSGGDAARAEIAAALGARPDGHFSDFNRPSLA